MKRSLILMALLLCACSTQPIPVVQVQKVDIPIAVSCEVEKLPVPEWSLDKISPVASYGERVRVALEDLALARKYIAEVQAAIEACN